ncbi:hypothetical protein ACR78G_05540 [Sphingobacterium spiritivorum]|uniref:hypothetical protein n=1 Tax=Sphingobacterium spiritivorum TaxID=258 RepID=UPI003DA53FD5
MNYKQDFETVDLILNSSTETRGVDAFVLSLVKAEKQIRRIFTFLIFQHSSYTIKDIGDLRKALADNNKVYFVGFLKGVDLILPRIVKDIYGLDYDKDIKDLLNFTKDRNKIFHGQITANGLTRGDLLEKVNHIRKWSETLGEKLKAEIGYDGFSDSFKKSSLILKLNNLDKFDTIDNYKEFIKDNLQR